MCCRARTGSSSAATSVTVSIAVSLTITVSAATSIAVAISQTIAITISVAIAISILGRISITGSIISVISIISVTRRRLGISVIVTSICKLPIRTGSIISIRRTARLAATCCLCNLLCFLHTKLRRINACQTLCGLLIFELQTLICRCQFLCTVHLIQFLF